MCHSYNSSVVFTLCLWVAGEYIRGRVSIPAQDTITEGRRYTTKHSPGETRRDVLEILFRQEEMCNVWPVWLLGIHGSR